MRSASEPTVEPKLARAPQPSLTEKLSGRVTWQERALSLTGGTDRRRDDGCGELLEIAETVADDGHQNLHVNLRVPVNRDVPETLDCAHPTFEAAAHHVVASHDGHRVAGAARQLPAVGGDQVVGKVDQVHCPARGPHEPLSQVPAGTGGTRA